MSTTQHWQKKFLEVGDYEIRKDLSVMIKTVSEIIEAEKSLWQAEARKEIATMRGQDLSDILALPSLN